MDKQIGKWYMAFNPAFEKSLHGPSVHQGFEFAPGAKVSYNINKPVAIGVEYYGALGPATEFDALRDQQHQLFFVFDLDVSPKWEINFGPGVGMTQATDHFIFKTIIGRRFDWGKAKPKP